MEVNRSLYFYSGSEINLAGIKVMPYNSIEMMADQPAIVEMEIKRHSCYYYRDNR